MTDITQQYSYLSACSDEQLRAIELLDDEWRNRNSVHLARAESAAGKIEPLLVDYPDLALLNYDYLMSGLVTLVSERLMNALVGQAGIEFFPVRGFYRSFPYADRRFFLMHCVNMIDALDRQRSIYREYSAAAGGGIKSVQKVVLDENAVGGCDFFLLKEAGVYCLSERLLEHVGGDYRGVAFRKLSDYADF